MTLIDQFQDSKQTARIKLALNQSVLIALTDRTGLVTHANDKYLAVVGLDRTELAPAGIRLFDPDRPSAATAESINDAIEQNAAWRGELKHRKQTGEDIWLDVTLVPFAAEKEPTQCVAICLDITDRHRVEEQLRQSEANLVTAQRVAHIGSWRTDVVSVAPWVTGRAWWSDEVYRIFGYEPGSIEPSRAEFLRIVHPDDRLRMERAVLEAAAFTTEYQVEHRIIRPDGEVRTVESIAQVFLDQASGQPTAIVGTIRDITQQKRTEMALRESEEQLRQSQKIEAVGKLAGGVAHDFNNLLAVILLHTDLLLAKVAADDPQRHRITEIREATERAAGLTRQLLAFSRAQVMQPRILDLNVVVTDTNRMLRRVIGEDVEIQLELDPRPAKIMADPEQVAQVILNLAVNARDAMPRGGRLSLQTAYATAGAAAAPAEVPPGEYAVLILSDNGHGMTPETRQRAFEPFYSTRGPGQGSGLGLSTVHGIVLQSGGHIALESEPGRGTSFRIYFPLVDETVAAEGQQGQPSLDLGSETVLVVEDEDQVRHLACEVLNLHGYQVVAAKHGAEAIALARDFAGPIHLLLTDVIMPKMGGPELARELQQMRPALCVLFMSGYTGDRLGDHGVSDDCREFISKPFTRLELARRVREVLDANKPSS
jgi:two-component system cell cycle sensor histidine kinase/response regulator CckA